MTREEFERTVQEALEGLPEVFRSKLSEVTVVVEARPPRGKKSRGRMLLLGLYEGTPLTERDGTLLPSLSDKITLFQEPIERSCRSREETLECIRTTVLHEVGHLFGIGDRKLRRMGY